MTRTLAILMG
jgi:micrococcal nuclease